MARKAARPEELFSTDDVPLVCPGCGQKIDQRSPDNIEHHRRRGHTVFTGYNRKPRKRRWQAAP